MFCVRCEVVCCNYVSDASHKIMLCDAGAVLSVSCTASCVTGVVQVMRMYAAIDVMQGDAIDVMCCH